MAQEHDSVLVKAALNGDGDSFTELCRRYYPAMVAITHSILGDRHLAEDAAQQAFAKAAVKLPHLRKQDGFAGWVAAISRNTARNMLRTAKRVHLHCIEDSSVAAESDEQPSVEVVRQALGKLAASARELIYLRFYDGLSYEQISSVLGISQQAINGRLRRAKRKLAEHLRREGLARYDYE